MCNYSIFLHFESQGKYFSLLNKKKILEGPLLSSDPAQSTGKGAAATSFCHLIQTHPQGNSQTSVPPLATSKSELSCTTWHGVFWVWAVESHLESGEHVIPMCNLTVRNTWLTSSPTVYRLLTANGSGFCVFVFQIANHTFLMSRHKKDLWGHLSRSWGNRPHSAFRFLLCLFVVFLNPGLWYCTAFQWQWFYCIRIPQPR